MRASFSNRSDDEPEDGSISQADLLASLLERQDGTSGGTYYLCGNTWFKPSYGANGVFYTVVPTP